MAVKPITNPNPKQPENIDRSKQLSERNVKSANSTNREQVVIPGKDFGKGFSITLKDIDSAVLNHIKNIMTLGRKYYS